MFIHISDQKLNAVQDLSGLWVKYFCKELNSKGKEYF